MELTQEHYRRGEIAYAAYCKQSGGKSLVSGDSLPEFSSLKQSIKDAWAAAAIALSLDADLQILKIRKQVAELEPRAAFGDQCYQDRCENAYIEQSVVKRMMAERDGNSH